MNGAKVILRRRDVIFIRLPEALQRDCGPCHCPYCKAHPDQTPRWDTVAVTTQACHPVDYTWTVHMPDPRAHVELNESGVHPEAG